MGLCRAEEEAGTDGAANCNQLDVPVTKSTLELGVLCFRSLGR